MLMYGCVVHKRVWKEVPKENTPMLSTSQSRQPSPSLMPSAGPRDTPFVADGFLSVQDERTSTSSRVIVALPSSSAYNAGDIRAAHRTVLLLALPLPLNYLLLSLLPPSRRIIGISLIRPSVEIIEGETKMSTPSTGREAGFWIKDDV